MYWYKSREKFFIKATICKIIQGFYWAFKAKFQARVWSYFQDYLDSIIIFIKASFYLLIEEEFQEGLSNLVLHLSSVLHAYNLSILEHYTWYLDLFSHILFFILISFIWESKQVFEDSYKFIWFFKKLSNIYLLYWKIKSRKGC